MDNSTAGLHMDCCEYVCPLTNQAWASNHYLSCKCLSQQSMETALSWGSTICFFTLLAHCNKWHRSRGNFPQRRCFSEGYACQPLPRLCFRPWGCRACRYPYAVTLPLSPHPRHCARILWWHNPGLCSSVVNKTDGCKKASEDKRHRPSGKRHEDLLTSYKITAAK